MALSLGDLTFTGDRFIRGLPAQGQADLPQKASPHNVDEILSLAVGPTVPQERCKSRIPFNEARLCDALGVLKKRE
jgi:hypothetical protein